MSEVDFSMLDGTVDDLADLKGFEPLPAGSYLLNIGWSQKEINDMPAVILKLTVIETLELTNNSETAPEAGKSTDIAFILKSKDKNTGELKRNEIGEGQLKEVVKVLAPVFSGANVKEVMAASEGAQIAATLKVRADKNDSDKKYNQIKSCQLPQ